MHKFDNYKLGESEEEINIDTIDDNVNSTLTMAQQATRSIDIISRKLDPAIYNTPEFIQAVKQLIIGSSRARVRILVFEPSQIVKRGHRLVDLSMSMSSYITINVPSKEHGGFNESLFITDATAYVYRLQSDRFEAKLNFNDKRTSRYLIHEFDEMWGRSRSDPNLRRTIL